MPKAIHATDEALSRTLRALLYTSSADALRSAAETGRTTIPIATKRRPIEVPPNRAARLTLTAERDALAASIHDTRMRFLHRAYTAYEGAASVLGSFTEYGAVSMEEIDSLRPALMPLADAAADKVGKADMKIAIGPNVQMDCDAALGDVFEVLRYETLRVSLGETDAARDEKLISMHLDQGRAAAAVLTVVEAFAHEVAKKPEQRALTTRESDEILAFLTAFTTGRALLGTVPAGDVDVAPWLDAMVSLAALSRAAINEPLDAAGREALIGRFQTEVAVGTETVVEQRLA